MLDCVAIQQRRAMNIGLVCLIELLLVFDFV